MQSRNRRWSLMASSATRNLLVLTLLSCSLLQPALAVLIPFENCLPESYQTNVPAPLQWVPQAVDAVFDLQNPSHNLRVTVYGNVTGSFVRVQLPPPGSPDWADPTKIDGKILNNPDPQGVNRATTLHSKINVLTYEPFDQSSYFCGQSLVNGSCPLAPVFNTTPIADWPYSLPSFNLSNNFESSYAFASFAATFLVIYGDASATNIGCVSATITPDLGSLKWMLNILPLVVLLFVGFATILAGNLSPWGSTDVFHWTSNYQRDADLLRLVTPGFGDCLQYIQFVALTGSLTLSYPGFYQPMASQAGWSTLMFNESFVSHAAPWQSVVDGMYVTNSTYGLATVGQLIGMANVEDIWAGMMVWLLVIIAATFVLVQAGFIIQWTYRKVKSTPEEDLRAKNIPFSIGNVVRIVFNYFLLPIVALSTFQLVVSDQSPAYTVALAALTLAIIIGFAAWLLYLIIRTRPRAVLFDDLPTVLLYGPLYNTYSDEAAAFALIPVLLTFMRGIAIGAVQPFGIAQLVLLAICEVIQILTLHAFRPFHSPTSMNAYHTICSVLRFVTILLMVAFVPSLGVTEGPKGWIGYAILIIHAMVLVFGFFLNALQTIAEVVARRLGAGGDDEHGLTRGGLSKIFGMRQLSRRIPRRGNGPSRSSQLSSTAMLDAEDGTKQGYVMAGGRIRSESAGSVHVLMNHSRQRSSSAFDSIDIYSSPPKTFDAASSFAPTTPGEASNFSFLPSPTTQGHRVPANIETTTSEPTGPYYRPPRRRRDTVNDSSASDFRRGSVTDSSRAMQLGGPLIDPAEPEDQVPAGATHPMPLNLPPRADYAHREVDFYYGVRGPALKSDGPGRKLGTGPADPTGPVATATGWFRNILGAKTKEKGKGFEVVRSARMPESMKARGGDFGDEMPPEGIPVAMGVIRNGPIDSDDDEPKGKKAGRHQAGDLLDDGGEPQSDPDEPRHVPDTPPRLPDIERGESLRLPSRIQSKASRNTEHTEASGRRFLPNVPRRSSRRLSSHEGSSRVPSANIPSPDSRSLNPPNDDVQPGRTPPFSSSRSSNASRLPFERTASQKRRSDLSSLAGTEDFNHMDLSETGHEERPTSYGIVPQHSISRVESGHMPQVNLLGSSAEMVDERAPSNSPHH